MSHVGEIKQLIFLPDLWVHSRGIYYSENQNQAFYFKASKRSIFPRIILGESSRLARLTPFDLECSVPIHSIKAFLCSLHFEPLICKIFEIREKVKIEFFEILSFFLIFHLVTNDRFKMTENPKQTAEAEKANETEKDTAESEERSQIPETFDEEFEAAEIERLFGPVDEKHQDVEQV